MPETQYTVAKKHLNKLQSMIHWCLSEGIPAELTICPHCNRDAVKITPTSGHKKVCFVDDAKLVIDETTNKPGWIFTRFCINGLGRQIYGKFKIPYNVAAFN